MKAEWPCASLGQFFLFLILLILSRSSSSMARRERVRTQGLRRWLTLFSCFSISVSMDTRQRSAVVANHIVSSMLQPGAVSSIESALSAARMGGLRREDNRISSSFVPATVSKRVFSAPFLHRCGPEKRDGEEGRKNLTKTFEAVPRPSSSCRHAGRDRTMTKQTSEPERKILSVYGRIWGRLARPESSE